MPVYAPPTISLGYAQITANATTASTTAAQVTGVTVTVTVPSTATRIKVTAYTAAYTNTSAGALGTLTLWDGTVGTGTQIGQFNMVGNSAATPNEGGIVMAVVTPAAGSKTYNLGFHVSAGTGTLNNAAINPCFILVEAI